MLGINFKFKLRKNKFNKVPANFAPQVEPAPTSTSSDEVALNDQAQAHSQDQAGRNLAELVNEQAVTEALDLLVGTENEEILVLLVPGLLVYWEVRLAQVEAEIKRIKARLAELKKKRDDILVPAVETREAVGSPG